MVMLESYYIYFIINNSLIVTNITVDINLLSKTVYIKVFSTVIYVHIMTTDVSAFL